MSALVYDFSEGHRSMVDLQGGKGDYLPDAQGEDVVARAWKS